MHIRLMLLQMVSHVHFHYKTQTKQSEKSSSMRHSPFLKQEPFKTLCKRFRRVGKNFHSDLNFIQLSADVNTLNSDC
jgi:hypothetical protein